MDFYFDDCRNDAFLVQYLWLEFTRLFGSKLEIFGPNYSTWRAVHDFELADVDFLFCESKIADFGDILIVLNGVFLRLIKLNYSNKIFKIKIMKKTVLALFIIAFSFFDAQNMKTVTVGTPYSISYPENFKKTYEFNETANFQVYDFEHDVKFIVLQDEIETLKQMETYSDDIQTVAKDYHATTISHFDEDKKKKVTKLKTFKKNGYEYASQQLEGATEDSERTFYYLVTVKTSKNHYQLVGWCLHKDRKKYEPLFEKMVNSFKEL